MKKLIAILITAIIVIAFAGCQFIPGHINEIIPANIWTNSASGGQMCEVNDKIYYVGAAGKYDEQIMSMNLDGSGQKKVSKKYDSIGQLIADEQNIYFIASTFEDDETLCSVSLSSGKEKKIKNGFFYMLQKAGDRLFWADNYWDDPKTTKRSMGIKSIKTNGTDFTLNIQGPYKADFITTDKYLFYTWPAKKGYDIFRMDVSGANKVKVTTKPLPYSFHHLFYDNGEFYLVTPGSFENDIGCVYDTVKTIDENGNLKDVIDKIGYFEMDYGLLGYSGISNGFIYYLEVTSSPGVQISMDLHQYEIAAHHNIVLKKGLEMGDNAVGIIKSARGKQIKNARLSGLYILGNDVYFSPQGLP
ncbi:MAG: DUF5050 domain-containing protein [Clostridia bacterium]|jgi:hypothetical protein